MCSDSEEENEQLVYEGELISGLNMLSRAIWDIQVNMSNEQLDVQV